LVAAWVGNDDNTAMSGLVSGITGAAPIWNDIMSHLLEKKTPEPMPRPPSVIQKQICSDTGLLPPPPGSGRLAPQGLNILSRNRTNPGSRGSKPVSEQICF